MKNDSYGIHEVFYENGVPFGISEDPITPYGADLEELEENFESMQAALKKDILDYDDF
jgi:DNA repair photolyase